MKNPKLIITLLLISIWWVGNAFAATSDSVAITATVAAGTSSIAVTQAAVAFGTITATEADHRFSAGPITVSYFAATSPWTIRVYTNNSPGFGAEPEKAGLVGADGVSYIPLKIWDANFGGTGIPPDPEIAANWEGLTAVWLRIPEADEQTVDFVTWRRLAYSGAELPAAGFDSYVALDAVGIASQDYSTSLTIDIISE